MMLMTDYKLLRYLDKQFVPPTGHQKLTPVIITDSKLGTLSITAGSRLRTILNGGTSLDNHRHKAFNG